MQDLSTEVSLLVTDDSPETDGKHVANEANVHERIDSLLSIREHGLFVSTDADPDRAADSSTY